MADQSLRIAIVNERWTAGATRCARDLQRGLANRHTVRYFPEGDEATIEGYLRGLKEFRPDVVHLHSFYGDLPYSFLGEVAARYPTVMTPHDPRPMGDAMLACWDCSENRTCFRCPAIGRLKRYTVLKHNFYRSRFEKRRIHHRLPSNTSFVCVSDWMRRRMMATELGRFNVERIYNGVDLDRFSRQPEARTSLGLAPDDKVLLFAAHHNGWTADLRKGGHVLAQALAEVVLPRFPNVIVLAVGGGMIPNLPNVRPIGFVPSEDMARYYSAADIFVAPSLADNLPYTVLEAMGCAVAVVASRVGGIPEEVEDGTTGRLVTPGSWQELGAALVSLLEVPQKTVEMGRSGRKRAEESFSLSGFVRQYEAVFASQLAQTH